MKPVKKTRVVIVEYWDCGMEDHGHKTRAVAENCIHKQATDKSYRRWDDAALRQVLLESRSGISPRDLSSKYAVSRERIYQVIRKAERRERYRHDPYQPLGIGP